MKAFFCGIMTATAIIGLTCGHPWLALCCAVLAVICAVLWYDEWRQYKWKIWLLELLLADALNKAESGPESETEHESVSGGQ